MPQYVIPTGFINMVMHFRVEGDPEDMLCGLGVEINATPTPAEWQAFVELFAGTLVNLVVGDYTLPLITKVIGDDAGPPYLTIDQVISGVGFGGGSAAPQNTASLFRKITNDAGPGSSGRMYIPGVPEAQIDNVGLLGTTLVEDVNAALVDFTDTGFETGPFDAIVLFHAEGSPLTSPSTIVSLILDPLVATQRQRLRR